VGRFVDVLMVVEGVKPDKDEAEEISTRLTNERQCKGQQGHRRQFDIQTAIKQGTYQQNAI
jgi:hypothetical protein